MESSTVDQVLAGNTWTFDADVTTVFDDMLARSIPQYDVMRQAVVDLTARYAPASVVDLGCSRGEMIARLVDVLPACQYTGIEISPPMLEAAQARFAGHDAVDIQSLDLRTSYPSHEADVTLSILTLQFTPIEYRQRILRDVYTHTRKAFILVEKVIGASAQVDSDMIALYYALKGANGYSPEQIERKRLSLEGVLVPVTAHWNEELLKIAGFSQVDCFWRWMNFAGWIAVK